MTALARPRTAGTGPPPICDPGDLPAALRGGVATIGVFDGVHRGHARLIGSAVGLGRSLGVPTLLVTFDPHPAAVLGLRKDTGVLSTPHRRAELAGALGVDAVVVLTFDDVLAARSPADFARTVLRDRLGTREIVVGTNFTFGCRGTGTVATLGDLGARYGFGVHPVGLHPVTTGDTACSSSYVRRCVRRGDLAAAARALGRPHRVDGVVVDSVVRTRHAPALLPAGRWAALADGRPVTAEVDGEVLRLPGHAAGTVAVDLLP